MNEQLDANEVISALLEEIAHQAKQMAMLNVQLGVMQRKLSESTNEEVNNGSDTL